MWEHRGKCVIFALAVTISFSNGYHISSETPGTASASFSGSSSSSSAFSSSSSNAFSASINGNLGSQHFEKLVDGLKNGAAATALTGSAAGAIAGSTAGAIGGSYSGAGIGCSGGCAGGDSSYESQGTGAYDAKLASTNQNANVYSGNANINSNVIPSGSGSCETCKGPFPGPAGSIHDYKLVSEIQSNSIAPSPTPTVPAVPHVTVPLVHNYEPPKHVVSQFPGSAGSIFDSKPASSVPSAPSIHSGVSVQSGAHTGVGGGYYTSYGQQDTFAGVAIHKGTSLSPEFIQKLPGAPGSIHDSIIPTGSQINAGAGAVGGTGYNAGFAGSAPNVHVTNIPTKHPLVGPACIWKPGSPPDGCGQAPEIVVPAPSPSVPAPPQPSGSGLGPVSKPNYHLFPGPTGSIHESKPASTGSVSTAGSNVYQSGTTNTGTYSEYDLPNQGVYYVNKESQIPSLAQDLEAPYQHTPSVSAQTPCREGDSTCGKIKPIIEPAHATERAPTCIGDHCDGKALPTLPNPASGGSTYIGTTQEVQITNYKPFPSPGCIEGGACAGEYPKPHCDNGVCGQPISGFVQGQKPEEKLNLQPYPEVASGVTEGGYLHLQPTPQHCNNGNCGQSSPGHATGQVLIQKQPDSSYQPIEHAPINLQPCSTGNCDHQQNYNTQNNQGTTFSLQPNPSGLSKNEGPNCVGGSCNQQPSTGFATGQVLIHKQDGTIENGAQNIPQNQPESDSKFKAACQRNGLCGQPLGQGKGQLLVNGQVEQENGAQNTPQPQPESNTACQKNGLCGQPLGFGRGQLLVHGQIGQDNGPLTPGFATGQVYIHKSDGSKVEVVEDGTLSTSGQPETQGCTSGSCGSGSNFGQGSQQQNGGTGLATGQVILQQNGVVSDITNSGGGSSTYGASRSQGGSYGASDSQGGSYGCLSGSCATGSNNYQRNSNKDSESQSTGCLGGSCSDLQPYGALAGTKFHRGGSYSGSGAFAGSFGGPFSHSLGLSRLTGGSSAHSGASAGSYAGAGSSAGAYASAGSFASSY